MMEGLSLSTGESIRSLEDLHVCLGAMEALTQEARKKGLKVNELLKDPILTASLEAMDRIRMALERIRRAFDEDAGKRLQGIGGIERVETALAKKIKQIGERV